MALIISVLAAAALLLAQATAQTCANINPANGAPQMAAGYQAKVVMNGLRTPRGIVFDCEGNLLIAEQGGTGVRWVKLQDNGGINVCVGQQKVLIPNGLVCDTWFPSTLLESCNRNLKANKLAS
jgi:glucose/arabinose dehydrogenase